MKDLIIRMLKYHPEERIKWEEIHTHPALK
jgi:hypothetical protein